MDWRPMENDIQGQNLEIVRVYRPNRIGAAICCFLCTLLLIISIGPTDWIETNAGMTDDRMREGLFRTCMLSSMSDTCSPQSKDFMKAVAALIIITWMLTLASGCLIVLGIFSRQDILKHSVYRSASIITILAGVILLVALIIFPVMVSQHLDDMVIETTWSIRWAYMLDWAALIIDVCAVVLLLNNRNTEETYIREISK